MAQTTDRQTDIATSRLNCIQESNEDVGLNRVKVLTNQKHKKNQKSPVHKKNEGGQTNGQAHRYCNKETEPASSEKRLFQGLGGTK